MANKILSTDSRSFGIGIHAFNDTIVIPRHRLDMGNGYPVPFLSSTHQLPAGLLAGADRDGTALVFGTGITGQFIKTEDYNAGDISDDVVSAPWNDGNTQGNTNYRYNFSAAVHDLTIFGQAQLHPYPWATNRDDELPDVYGPNFVHRADALCMQGGGHSVERVRFSYIPGACLIIKGGHAIPQSGAYGIIDDPLNYVRDVRMAQAMYGINVAVATDTKIDNVYGSAFVKDGITCGISTVISNSHIYGADRSLVAPYQIHATNLYMESARVGVHLTNSYINPETGSVVSTPGAHNSYISGLEIGPGTIWNRGILCETNGNTILGVTGKIRAQDATYTDIAAIEIASGTCHNYIQLNGEGHGQLQNACPKRRQTIC
jgi:hypothetical protein